MGDVARALASEAQGKKPSAFSLLAVTRPSVLPIIAGTVSFIFLCCPMYLKKSLLFFVPLVRFSSSCALTFLTPHQRLPGWDLRRSLGSCSCQTQLWAKTRLLRDLSGCILKTSQDEDCSEKPVPPIDSLHGKQKSFLISSLVLTYVHCTPSPPSCTNVKNLPLSSQ